MMEAIEEEMPLTSTWKKLADDEATFEVMMVDVPTDPPMLEVIVLPEALKELEVERLVTARLVAVAEETERLEDTRLLDTVRLVADALVRVVFPVTLSEVRLAVPRSAP
jgi:hypothetical protein